ncbi:MAG: hypothetical protein GY810_32230 [Aureispira sp.]|nr:hypothetical protein [Aureispira sp.]
MENLDNSNLDQFELWKGNSRIVIDKDNYSFYVMPHQIGILGGRPFVKGTYMLRTKRGNFQLGAIEAKQCGKGDFEVTLEPTKEGIDLVEIVRKEWLF